MLFVDIQKAFLTDRRPAVGAAHTLKYKISGCFLSFQFYLEEDEELVFSSQMTPGPNSGCSPRSMVSAA